MKLYVLYEDHGAVNYGAPIKIMKDKLDLIKFIHYIVGDGCSFIVGGSYEVPGGAKILVNHETKNTRIFLIKRFDIS